MKKLFALFLPLLFAFAAHATHNRAGEITYRKITDLTYEATIITYTKESSPADRPDLEIFWGDGTSDTISRINGGGNGEIIGNDIKKNIYIGVHTYSSIGSYCMFFEDPNRNAGVINIPNSVNIPFYVQTCLYMNPFLGANNSPILLNPPIDDACINKPYIHNPGAYDPDGDSLSYELTVCLGLGGDPIPGYSFPGGINVDVYSGDFTWNVPTAIGEYNYAMYIHEWRNGIKIGTVTRDMQITVINCDNNPPVINTILDTCVEAGTLLEFMVYGSDPDLLPVADVITMTSTSGLYAFNGNPDEPDFPAQFPQPVIGGGNVSAEFSWQTACSDVQLQPHTVSFRLQDNDPIVSLVDYHTVNITVVGPAPENPTANPVGNTIHVGWDASICTQASCYRIYRRNGYYGFIPDHCETGVPGYTGYTFIGSVSGLNTTTFIDDNNGAGLVHGVEYCYMIVACYPDGAESYASVEVCTDLVKDIPVITHVSIIATDLTTGSDSVVWSKPTELDTVQIPPPYEYRLYRSNDFTGSSFTLAATFNDLNDTVYVDTNVNTEGNPLAYKIELYSVPLDLIVGSTQASSVFLSITETDNQLILSWEENVPWTNYTYEIYKFNGTDFIFLDSTDLQTYTDTGLVNGTSYCYKIRSIGSYFSNGIMEPLYNFSQEKCGTPLDSTPPCPPMLVVIPDCDNYQNELSWSYLDPAACSDDIVEYRIYYTPFLDSAFNFLVSIPDPTQIEFMHDSILSIAGCYAITAVDSMGNESAITDSVCVDNCPEYELPNIFTPGEDNFNDFFVPFPYRYIQSINLIIYNRWGNIVFETTDPAINWDGTNQDSKLMCSDGVYFYVCEVNEIHLTGIETRKLKGFVHLIRGPGSSN
jgi:gliding motility-associated-like protein